ncbi:MAG: GLPGLI family protein [Gemmatimonadota bacterium]
MLRRLTLGLLLLPGALAAQEGTIAYTHAVKLDLELPPEMRARLEARGGRGGLLPTERVNDVVLLFNGSESLMKPVPPAPEARSPGGPPGLRDRREGMMARMRRISASRRDRETVVEAYVRYDEGSKRDSSTIEAWFTPQIPVPGGPAMYGGLPGMILVVSVDEGQEQYNATAVSLTAVAEGVIVRPTEGDVVSRERYEEIVAEKLEELRTVGGGG